MVERIPAEVFPPGEFIREELKARDWTQADFAEILGRPPQAVNEIISGKKRITAETAQEIGAAFGTGPKLWLNLESTYRLSLARCEDKPVARRAKVFEKAPVKEMTKRRWIEATNNIDDLEQQVIRFLELESIDGSPRLHAAARKSTSYVERTPSEEAWFFRAKQLAETIDAAPFSNEKLIKGLPELRKLAVSKQDIGRVPGLLSEWGVRLVIVEHLSKTRIDGGTLWLDDESPIIGMSLRYDRIDWFWFTLSHELAHVTNGDGKDGWILDLDLVGRGRQKMAEKPQREQRADRFASNYLVPRKKLESFISRVRPLFSKKRIVQFANRIEIHPGIVVGQLQYLDEIGYSHSREMLVKVRNTATEAVLTDGWGRFWKAF